MQKSNKPKFQLSASSKRDLENIYAYTQRNFGIKQANFYVSSFDKTFKNLTANPLQGIIRDELKRGLFSIRHKEHIIFYRINPKQIWIVRILHGSRDFMRHV